MKELEYYDPKFYGTDQYHKGILSPLLHTDSVAYFCKEKRAYWLVDMVASYYRRLHKHNFAVITLIVDDNQQAVFEARTDTIGDVIVRQKIQYTDLDVNVKLYFDSGVLMFPSDY
jgi:hypothetical protein